jgi:hypothetical protein
MIGKAFGPSVLAGLDERRHTNWRAGAHQYPRDAQRPC